MSLEQKIKILRDRGDMPVYSEKGIFNHCNWLNTLHKIAKANPPRMTHHAQSNQEIKEDYIRLNSI